jgi:talin
MSSCCHLIFSDNFVLLQALHSPEQHKSHATPEELVRCTKSITVATAKAVAAGNSCKQEDIIVAANMGRKAISDMLTTCKVPYENRKFVLCWATFKTI